MTQNNPKWPKTKFMEFEGHDEFWISVKPGRHEFHILYADGTEWKVSEETGEMWLVPNHTKGIKRLYVDGELRARTPLYDTEQD